MNDNIPNRRTVYDWIIEIIALCGMVCTCIPVFFYDKLGQDVSFPIHYNHYGNPDGWGGSKFLFIFILVAIAIYTFLTLSETLFKRFYAGKTDKQDAFTRYRRGIQLTRHIKMFAMLIFAYMSNTFLYQALSGTTEQPYSFILTWLWGLLAASIVFFIIKPHTTKSH